jgi:hypothetical protein
MTPAVAIKYALFPGCRYSERNPDFYFLPLRSLLGTFEHPLRQPTGEWPLVFVCLRHGQSFVCSLANVRPESEMLAQGLPIPPMWAIGVVCAHEHCGRLHAIYAGGTFDGREIERVALKKSVPMRCSDHAFVWPEELTTIEELPHSSPVP